MALVWYEYIEIGLWSDEPYPRASNVRQGLECGSPLPPSAAIPAKARQVRCRRHDPQAETARRSARADSRLKYSAARCSIIHQGLECPQILGRTAVKRQAWKHECLFDEK